MTPLADTPSDPPAQGLVVRGGLARITDEGAGPLVLAVHGLPGSGRDFRWLAGPLSRTHRVVRLDLPGFGGTPAALCAPTRADHVAFVLDVLDALGVQRATLLVHSFGALVALGVAAAAPERVSALALLAPAGLRPHKPARLTPAPQRLAGGLRAPVLGAALRPLARRLFGTLGFRHVRDDEIARVLDVMGGWDWASGVADAARVRAPTLLAACDDDRLVERPITDELSAALPAGPRLRPESGGHGLLKSRRVEIVAALQPWLAALSAPPPHAPAAMG